MSQITVVLAYSVARHFHHRRGSRRTTNARIICVAADVGQGGSCPAWMPSEDAGADLCIWRICASRSCAT